MDSLQILVHAEVKGFSSAGGLFYSGGGPLTAFSMQWVLVS